MTQQKDAASMRGTVLGGKYRLDRLLGAGGMGAVYAAENTALRAPVAIKVLHAAVSAQPEFRDRFALEAQAAAQVRHPNVVSVLDFGYDEAAGLFYIVQEFLAGADLKRHVRERGPLAARDAITLLLPIMRALAHAHAKGVVHRDLKPDNIFLCETPDGIVPKLIDFGIAKVTDERGQSAQHTSTNMAIGTPHYMSPEQARGDRTLDPRTDVWSLGVVLYYALTQRLPYEAPTLNLVLASIITAEPVRVNTYNPSLPVDVVALVHGALVRDRAHRYPSMDAFWQAARACSVVQPGALLASSPGVGGTMTPTVPVQGLPALLAASPQVAQSGPVPTSSAVTASPQVVAVAPPSRRAAPWIAGIAFSVLALVGGLAFVGSRSPSRRLDPADAATPRAPLAPLTAATPTAATTRPIAPTTPLVHAAPSAPDAGAPRIAAQPRAEVAPRPRHPPHRPRPRPNHGRLPEGSNVGQEPRFDY